MASRAAKISYRKDEDRTEHLRDKRVIIKDVEAVDCSAALARTKHASPSVKRPRDMEQGKIAQGNTNSSSDVVELSILKKAKLLQSENKQRHLEKRKEKMKKYKKMDIQSKDDYPTLFTRSSPQCLYNAVRYMNNRQKKAVQDMGFGHILNLNIKMMPGRLGYWVVDNFNFRTCELMLPNGRTLTVTEDDVRRVYGFPDGDRKIVPLKREETTDLYEEWKLFFGKAKIRLPDIQKEMLRCKDGGSWFKRNFIILLTSSLIESHKSGNVIPYVIRCLDNLAHIKEWNWAEYAMTSLVTTKRTWAKDTSKMFTGPTLFLIIYYCDRVAFCYDTIGRSFPLFKNWTDKKLREREKEEINEGGFGVGQICDPISLAVAKNEEATVQDNYVEDEESSEHSKESTEIESCADKILHNLKMYNDLRDKIILLIEGASDAEMADKKFKDAMTAANAALIWRSVKHLDATPNIEDNNVAWEKEFPGFDNEDDLYWEDVPMHESIDATIMKKSAEKSKQFDEFPSFSLGLTQMGELHEGASGSKDTELVATAELARPNLISVSEFYKTPDRENIEQQHGNNVVNENMESGQTLNRMVLRTIPSNEHNIHSFGIEKSVNARQKCPVTVSFQKGGRGKENILATPNILQVQHKIDATKKKEINVLQARGLNEIQFGNAMPQKRRSKQYLKPTEFSCSPYLQRRLNPSKQLVNYEKELGMFAMHNTEDEKEEVLFDCKGIELRRFDMVTLRKGNIVGSSVIDAWSMLLNEKEQYRAPGSPVRFFASTKICPPRGHNYVAGKDFFFRQLTAEIAHYNHTKHTLIDMFVFPVYSDTKFYAIAIDARIGKVWIIDNMNEAKGDCDISKYGWIVFDVQNHMIAFLHYLNCKHKANLLKKAKPVAMLVKWGDRKNIIDTGVYVMRHMEAYMGESESTWSSGLLAKSRKQLNLLRVRYCVALLGWDANNVKDEVAISAEAFYKDLLKNPHFNIEDTLVGV